MNENSQEFNKIITNRSKNSVKNEKQQTTQLQDLSNFPPPITYIWFGKQIPQDYAIKVSQLNYPVQLIINPYIKRKFKRPLKQIQKADYHRLQYLYENGGIYSDFDNQIDYQCMKSVLVKYKNDDRMIFWWDTKKNVQTRNVVPNSFIYANHPKMPALKTILQNINQQNHDLNFAGMLYLPQFANKQLIQVKQLFDCIKHEYDFTWIKQSGKQNKQQKNQVKKKKIKKVEVIKQLQKVNAELEKMKRQYNILQEQYNVTKNKLQQEYRSHYVKRVQQDKRQSSLVQNNMQKDTQKGGEPIIGTNKNIQQNIEQQQMKQTNKMSDKQVQQEKQREKQSKYFLIQESIHNNISQIHNLDHNSLFNSQTIQNNYLQLTIVFLSVLIVVLICVWLKKLFKNKQQRDNHKEQIFSNSQGSKRHFKKLPQNQ